MIPLPDQTLPSVAELYRNALVLIQNVREDGQNLAVMRKQLASLRFTETQVVSATTLAVEGKNEALRTAAVQQALAENTAYLALHEDIMHTTQRIEMLTANLEADRAALKLTNVVLRTMGDADE